MMGRLLRRRPSPAMIVALIALFVALGGSSYAAIKISTKNLRTGAVNSRVLKNNSAKSGDIRNESLTGSDIKTDSIKNADIDNSTLQAKTADTANKATTADSATNATSLGGVAAANFTQRTCTSQTGAVKGFARIAASAAFSATFTTTGVENPYNCSDGTIEARRLGVGTYEVKFNGASPVLAFVSVLEDGIPTLTAVTASVVTPGTFRVQSFVTSSGTSVDNVKFVIAAL
jgi:hypothetical protein